MDDRLPSDERVRELLAVLQRYAATGHVMTERALLEAGERERLGITVTSAGPHFRVVSRFAGAPDEDPLAGSAEIRDGARHLRRLATRTADATPDGVDPARVYARIAEVRLNAAELGELAHLGEAAADALIELAPIINLMRRARL